MISKIDCLLIVRHHLATLRDYGKNKVSIADWTLFFVVPAIVAGVVVFGNDRTLTKGAIDFLATVFSIFIGLLLNLMVLIFSVSKKTDPSDDPGAARRQIVLEQTFSNISYAIFISVLLVTLLFIAKLATCGILAVISFVAFAIVGNFVLTLLMILKRVHTLLSAETAV